MAKSIFEELGGVLFGTAADPTAAKLKSDIDSLQARLGGMGANDPDRQNLEDQLRQMRARYEAEMRKQGATDASGRLLAAKDVQGEYMDRDYLALKRQQAQGQEALALSQGLKQAKQSQLQGGGDVTRDVMGKVESIKRAADEGLANTIRDETLRAKGEAGMELGRKQGYATGLIDKERQGILDTLNEKLRMAGLTMSQISAMQDRLNSMDNGLLNQVIAAIGQIGGKWVASQIGAGGDKGSGGGGEGN